VRQGESDGLAVVDITVAVTGQQLSQLRIRIAGQPLGGGGVQMTSSRVTLGSASNPDQLQGRVTALEGTTVRARLSDASGTTLTLVAQLLLDESGNVGGSVSVSPSAGR